MKSTGPRFPSPVAAALSALLAASCGGGGDDGRTPYVPYDGPSFPCVDVRTYDRADLSAFAPPVTSTSEEPPAGGCVFDPTFGSVACKVGDPASFPPAESAGVVRPVYSRWRHDSADGSHYFLVKGGETPPGSGTGQLVIVRTADDAVVKVVTEAYSGEDAEFRWDYTGQHPTRLYFREECRFQSYDFDTGAVAVLHDFAVDFPGCGRILNDVEGDSSADSRVWAFMVQGAYDGANYPMAAVVAWDRVEDRILGTLDLAAYRALGGTAATLPRPNMVDVSPSGHRVVALFPRTDDGTAFDGPHAFRPDFADPVKVCNDESHSGWAFDADGREVYLCQVTNTNWPNAPADTLAYTDPETGATEVMLFHEDLGWDVGGFHFGRSYDPAVRGWAYVSTYSDTATSTSWMRNMAVMVEVKPYAQHPRVWRIAPTHNDYPGPDGYSREAYSPLSGDGRWVMWGADWEGGGHGVSAYRVRLPDRWWERLGEIPACPR
jgi:hypothetical protein